MSLIKIQSLTGLVAFFSLLLMGMTAPLWKPQTVFPQVPLIRLALEWPIWVDWISLVCLLGSATLLLALASLFRWTNQQADPKGAIVWTQKISSSLFFVSYVFLVLRNQHRLQPWAYQFAIGLLILAFLPAKKSLVWFRWLVISLYFYSALSKLEYSFLHTLGAQILEGLLHALGIGVDTSGWEFRPYLVALFPLVELVVAFGLAIPKTRQWAMLLSVGIHGALLLALGPWGLNHQWGVLGWNLFFIIQNILLFGSRNHSQEPPGENENREQIALKKNPSTGPSIVMGGIVFVLLAPSLEWIGYYDHWPSWGLYSTAHDRVTLLVAESAVPSLPDTILPFVEASPIDPGWVRVRTDRWSLATLKSPLYPQARFQLGVACAVGEKLQQATSTSDLSVSDTLPLDPWATDTLGSNDGPKSDTSNFDETPFLDKTPYLNTSETMKVLYEGPANRFSGKRQKSICLGLLETQTLGSKYWFNTQAR